MARARRSVWRRSAAHRLRGPRRRKASGERDDERGRQALGDHPAAGRKTGLPAAAVRRCRLRARRPEARRGPPRARRAERTPMIPAAIERRARWVLDSVGATDVGFGDDLPYNADAWERVDRGERPESDDIAEGFFHLARVEEKNAGPRDEHGRFRAEWSCLDPLDPPLERLRRRLGVGAIPGPRFTVALTHDVDAPWRWSRIGVRGAAARLKQNVRRARLGPAVREATGLATAPLHLVRGTDPNWRFEQIVAE